MSDKIQIIDIIHHRNKYDTEEFIVLNRWPNFLYEKTGRYLWAEEDGFFNFYGHDSLGMTGPSHWKAFGGRKFNIPMKDGTTIEASGQWWDSTPPEWSGLVQSTGAATPEMLARCNVFCCLYVDPYLIDKWLGKGRRITQVPSNNYNRYDKRHPDFGKHEIDSRFKH